MQNHTRVLFNSYLGQLAKLNSLDGHFFAPGSTEIKSFSVAPAIEQKLLAKLQTTSDFLSRINVISVVNQMGDRVGVGTTRSLASRTDLSVPGNRRRPTNPFGSDPIDQYVCKKTDYDYAWPYALLDACRRPAQSRLGAGRLGCHPVQDPHPDGKWDQQPGSAAAVRQQQPDPDVGQQRPGHWYVGHRATRNGCA